MCFYILINSIVFVFFEIIKLTNCRQRNSTYAKIGGLSVLELNRLEIELVCALGFVLDVDPQRYGLYEVALKNRASKRLLLASSAHD